MSIPNPALVPPGISGPPAVDPNVVGQPVRPQEPKGPAFAEVLANRTEGVHFSNHELQRVGRRNIDVEPATLARLDSAVQKAAGKGAREAVVLVDDSAFVVSVRNRTVITAIDREQLRDHVFTNIDSAVIG